MGIFMFITFASANLITIGAMWYGFMSQYRYNNGMVLGVHIPPEHAEEPEVTEQVTNARRKMKRFHIINLILIMALSILCFFNMALYVIIWIVWIFAYIGAAIYFNAAMHRKLYDYKVAQGWLVEGQKKKVYIDTAVLTMTEKSAVPYRYHAVVILIEILCVLPFLCGKRPVFWEEMGIFCICAVAVSVTAWIAHVFINRRQHTVYSQDTQKNQQVNYLIKKYTGEALLAMSSCNAAAWVMIAVQALIFNSLNAVVFYSYVILESLSGVAFLVLIFQMYKKKNAILNADGTPVYVDDDEYWKTGFYYNPNDSRMLVSDRMQSGNYSFNYATAGAKIWTGILTFVVAGTIIFTVAAMLPLIHVKVDFTMDNNRVTVEGGGYKITFDKESIQRAELLDTMPRDNFTKTNGGATETYAVGHFKGNTYGKCMLFIYKGNAPYILIQTDTQTMFFNAKDSSMTKQWYEQLCE